LDGVDLWHKERPCPVTEWGKIVDKEYVNVSRVCLLNNGGFAVTFAYHNCPGHQYAEASGSFPADVMECKDVQEIYPSIAEGETVRAATVADAGLHEILDPAIRFVPNSNAAGWECAYTGRGTYNYDCKLLSVAPVDSRVLPEASKVCVINQAGFDMFFSLFDERSSRSSNSSYTYPVNQQECLSMKYIPDLQEGDEIKIVVQAVGANQKAANRKVVYKDNGLPVAFQCKGAVYDYDCDILTSPTLSSGVV